MKKGEISPPRSIRVKPHGFPSKKHLFELFVSFSYFRFSLIQCQFDLWRQMLNWQLTYGANMKTKVFKIFTMFVFFPFSPKTKFEQKKRARQTQIHSKSRFVPLVSLGLNCIECVERAYTHTIRYKDISKHLGKRENTEFFFLFLSFAFSFVYFCISISDPNLAR